MSNNTNHGRKDRNSQTKSRRKLTKRTTRRYQKSAAQSEVQAISPRSSTSYGHYPPSLEGQRWQAFKQIVFIGYLDSRLPIEFSLRPSGWMKGKICKAFCLANAEPLSLDHPSRSLEVISEKSMCSSSPTVSGTLHDETITERLERIV